MKVIYTFNISYKIFAETNNFTEEQIFNRFNKNKEENKDVIKTLLEENTEASSDDIKINSRLCVVQSNVEVEGESK